MRLGSAPLEREDVRRAERQAAQQSADIGVAEAEFYPHIAINGSWEYSAEFFKAWAVTVRARAGSRVAAPWNLHSGDGSIDATLPDDLKATIDASTSDGHISLGIAVTVDGTLNSSRITGKMNGGGLPIVLRTSDGSIHLSKS